MRAAEVSPTGSFPTGNHRGDCMQIHFLNTLTKAGFKCIEPGTAESDGKAWCYYRWQKP